jgi:hypothetical protein
VLAISPHLDDAALSVEATLADLATHSADIHGVTLFAGTPTEPLSIVARTFHTTCACPKAQQQRPVSLVAGSCQARAIGAGLLIW